MSTIGGVCSDHNARRVFAVIMTNKRILLLKNHNADEEYSIEVDPRTTLLLLVLYVNQKLPDIRATMPLYTIVNHPVSLGNKPIRYF